MKGINLLLFVAIGGLLFSCQSQNEAKPMENTSWLRHAVMFKFKDSASAADIDRVVAAFKNLPTQIPEIKAFEWGTNNSPEMLNQGLTHFFLLSFADEKGRDIYLPHPAHKEFGKILGPFLDKVLVVDYWSHH
jgi:hypothetical protein